MSKLVHKSTLTLKLLVMDGEYEERFAMSSDKIDEAVFSLVEMCKLVVKRNNTVVIGFSWGPRDPAEVDQFYLTEVSS